MYIDENNRRRPTVDDSSIEGFFDQYRFLSNFEVCDVHIDGINYRSSEHAYMALKSTSHEERLYIASLATPKMARDYGQTMQLRPNWKDIRPIAMYRACHAKFLMNPHLWSKLDATGNKKLIESNNWGDHYWGVCWKTGEGESMLGKVLMMVREDLRSSLQLKMELNK